TVLSRVVILRLGLFRGIPRPRRPTSFPYTTLFRSLREAQDDRLLPGRGAGGSARRTPGGPGGARRRPGLLARAPLPPALRLRLRSEEHTSELQSRENLVCRLLLEKKNDKARLTAHM